jgi:hypothetical protein
VELQLAFVPASFTIRRRLARAETTARLDVFLHPNTGDELATTATARSGWASRTR